MSIPGANFPNPKEAAQRRKTILMAAVTAFLVVATAGGCVLTCFGGYLYWPEKPVASTDIVQTERPVLKVTPAGDPIKLPPVASNITRGPPIPAPPLHADQCGDLLEGGPVNGPGCVTAEIHCDEMLIGHTVGGVDEYDSTFYEKKFCWPKLLDHDGGDERVYRLVMPPGDWTAWATMHTPCADLDLAAFRHDENTCPDEESALPQCEMKPESGRRVERLELTSQTKAGKHAVWYIVVEGKRDEEGAFSLHVQCSPGLAGH